MTTFISDIKDFLNHWFLWVGTPLINETKKTFWEQFEELVRQISNKGRAYSVIQDIRETARQKWILEKQLISPNPIIKDIYNILGRKIINYKEIGHKLEELEENINNWIL